MMKKYYVIVFFSIVALLGCTQIIRVDAENYLQNQSFYEGKHILIKADLEDVLEKYELYQGKDVELTAPITYFGNRGFSRWYVTLERNEKKIRCYEDRYRYYLPSRVFYLARWAKSEGGEVTVRGKLKEDGIELNQLAYKSYVVNTNYLPLGTGYNYNN